MEVVKEPSIASLAARGSFGGVLMGLANLVPGISGGTMLLAAGVYPRFINAVAEVSTLRFRYRSIVLLIAVAGAAGLGILLLAGVLKDLVVDYRWVMYSLFIGLTLGGLPVVYRLVRPMTASAVVAAAGSFLAMAVLAILQATGVVGAGGSNLFMLFVAGLAGASAMILPGLSGGYVLLLLGQYVPILSAIESFKLALENRDPGAAMDPALSVMLPVGVGLIVGIVGISNLLKWLLHRYRKATLGILIGLLLGSVVGLWPYQRGVEPIPGETVIKGTPVTVENLAEFEREDWPTEFFAPGASQVGISLALVLLGFSVTVGIAKVGGDDGIP